jgi:hypothetical protein
MDEYLPQIQGNMWVCEREHAWFVSFCPWVADYPIVVRRIDRDETLIKRLSESALDAADEVDDIVREVRRADKRSDVQDLAMRARQMWDAALAMNAEVQL